MCIRTHLGNRSWCGHPKCMGSVAGIVQLEGRGPESCLSCPKPNRFPLEYIICARL